MTHIIKLEWWAQERVMIIIIIQAWIQSANESNYLMYLVQWCVCTFKWLWRTSLLNFINAYSGPWQFNMCVCVWREGPLLRHPMLANCAGQYIVCKFLQYTCQLYIGTTFVHGQVWLLLVTITSLMQYCCSWTSKLLQ